VIPPISRFEKIMGEMLTEHEQIKLIVRKMDEDISQKGSKFEIKELKQKLAECVHLSDYDTESQSLNFKIQKLKESVGTVEQAQIHFNETLDQNVFL